VLPQGLQFSTRLKIWRSPTAQPECTETNMQIFDQLLLTAKALHEFLKRGDANGILNNLATQEKLLADLKLQLQGLPKLQNKLHELMAQLATVNRQNLFLAQNGVWVTGKLTRILSGNTGEEFLYTGEGRLQEHETSHCFWDGHV
jgi:hypothetical protein